jgi:hypothetical protein
MISFIVPAHNEQASLGSREILKKIRQIEIRTNRIVNA